MKLKKLLAIGIIFLFIGVAVAPSINSSVVKTSDENDLIEVTSQACGIQGFGNTTTKLTKQQYQNLEQYLVDFRARLNQTTTREEAVPIFKDAVVELNKYGLLPKGMSVEKAQSLVTSKYQIKNIEELQRKLSRHRFSKFDNNSNFLCLIAGKTNTTCILGLIQQIFLIFGLLNFGIDMSLLIPLSYYFRIFALLLYISMFLCVFSVFSAFLGLFLPVTFLSWIVLGFSIPDLGTGDILNFPAQGWVDTLGLNGKKSWKNDIYGKYSDLVLCVGGIGFTGIKLILPPYQKQFPYTFFENNNFYLGASLAVKIDSNPP